MSVRCSGAVARLGMWQCCLLVYRCRLAALFISSGPSVDQVEPKLDDREIFVTHLPPKASTEESGADFCRAEHPKSTGVQDGVRFLLGNFGDIDEAKSSAHKCTDTLFGWHG